MNRPVRPTSDHTDEMRVVQVRCCHPTHEVIVRGCPPYNHGDIARGIASAAELIAKEMGKNADDARGVYDGVMLLSLVEATCVACVLDIDVIYHIERRADGGYHE